MKKHILLFAVLFTVINSAFALDTKILEVKPVFKPALSIQTIADDVKKLEGESILVKTTELLPLTNPADLVNAVNTNFKDLSKPDFLNIQTASIALHNAYSNASEKLENILKNTTFPDKTIDTIINVLVKLYKGESYANATKGLPFGFSEGDAGKLVALIANAANLVQKLHTHFVKIKLLPEVIDPSKIQHGGIISQIKSSLIPAPRTTEGTTFTEENTKAKNLIAYAIGRLVIYKSEIIQITGLAIE